MKLKMGGVVAGAFLLLAFFVSAAKAETTIKSHKVTLKNLTVDSVDTDTKTILAHSDSVPGYTIILENKGKVRRGTGERAELSEIFEGDSITVWGKTADGTNIAANKIKDHSIRKIKGASKGIILSVAEQGQPFPFGASGGCLLYVDNETFSIVWTYDYTKFKFGKQRVAYSSLQEGDVVLVKGIQHNLTALDPLLFFIYNTTEIKVRNHGTSPGELSPSMLKLMK